MTTTLNYGNITLSTGSNLASTELLLGAFGGNRGTFVLATHAANRTYTFADAGANASIIVSEGNQTINGNKTFTGLTTIAALDLATLELSAASNQLIFQPGNAGNSLTVSVAPNPAANSIYTIPDVGTVANFILSAGTQTLTGLKTFSATITSTATSNQLVITPGANSHTLTASNPVASVVHTFSNTTGTIAHTNMMSYLFGFDADISTTSAAYVRLKSFVYPGADSADEKFTSVSVFVTGTNLATMQYRLVDVTNASAVIAESAAITGTGAEQSATLGTVTAANILSTAARYELQGKNVVFGSVLTLHGMSLAV